MTTDEKRSIRKTLKIPKKSELHMDDIPNEEDKISTILSDFFSLPQEEQRELQLLISRRARSAREYLRVYFGILPNLS